MDQSAPIVFLHTARPNVAMFGELMTRLAPSVPVRHELLESVMLEAAGTGALTESMRGQTESAIRTFAADGATLIVCTCSTIGGVAEATVVDRGVRVMRIDRPMAEAAVASGRRIVVAATLQSTVRPTVELMRNVAADADRQIDLVEVMCADAWPHYQRGDHAAYAAAIADAVAAQASGADIVVLAQASMAHAAPLLAARGIDAIASPETGVRAALGIYARF